MLLSLSMCVTLTLCVFSKNFLQNFFQNFSNIFFKIFCQNFFQNCDTRRLQWYLWSPGLGSRKVATQVVSLSLASLGLVAANSRLHASLTFYVRNPNLVRFFRNFFQKFFPRFFQYFFKNFCSNFFQNCDTRLLQWYLWSLGLGSRKFATQVVYLSLASLGLVAANSRLHASFTFYVRNPNLVRFFQIFFQNFFP